MRWIAISPWESRYGRAGLERVQYVNRVVSLAFLHLNQLGTDITTMRWKVKLEKIESTPCAAYRVKKWPKGGSAVNGRRYVGWTSSTRKGRPNDSDWDFA